MELTCFSKNVVSYPKSPEKNNLGQYKKRFGAGLLLGLFLFLLLSFPASADVINGDFSQGNLSWNPEVRDSVSGTPTVTFLTSGSWDNSSHCCLYARGDYDDEGGHEGWSYVNISQNVDLTGVDFLSFRCRMTKYHPTNTAVFYSIIIDNTTAFSPGQFNTSWTNQTVNISSYTGVHNLKFQLYARGSNNWNAYCYGYWYLDDISLHYGSSTPDTPYDFNNSTTWTCPANVTSVNYMLIGPGGAGGDGGYGNQGLTLIDGAIPWPSVYHGGGGGGGGTGGYKTGTSSVIPGHTYNLIINSEGTFFDSVDSVNSGASGNDGGDASYSSNGAGGAGGAGGAPSGVSGQSGDSNGNAGIGSRGFLVDGVYRGGGGDGGRGCYGYPDNFWLHPNMTYDSNGFPIGYITDSAWFDKIPGSAGQSGFIRVIPIYNTSGGSGGYSPTADFVSNTQSGLTPLTVSFSDLSTASPTLWAWTFGDGETSAEQNPSHTYDNPETYNVTLTVSNAQGSDDEIKVGYITVTNANDPVADFSNSPFFGIAPLEVDFTDSSTGSPTSWSWDFGDGSTSTDQNPTHTYDTAGSYNVTLTVSNSYGADEKIKTYAVYVNSPDAPIASFSGYPREGYSPLEVDFTDSSTGSPTSWLWNFGDGSTSTHQNPRHTYNSPGYYNVVLIATNSYGSSMKAEPSYISVSGIGAPVSDFSANPQTGTSPLEVDFTDSSTGSPTSWSWNFGDGSTSTEQNPSHIYSNPGIYTVQLIATNSAGSSLKVKTNLISVSSIGAPVSDFSANPQTGTSPLEVDFTDSSTGSPTSWSWNFGDGSTSTEQNPSHTYSNPGIYTVQLIASNEAGSSLKIRTNYISILPSGSIVADFSFNPTSGSAPLHVQFTDESVGSPASWYWDFGDGSTSASQNPIHYFYSNRSYTVSLLVSNGVATDSISKTIDVSEEEGGGTWGWLVNLLSPLNGIYDFFTNTTDESDSMMNDSALVGSISNIESDLNSGLYTIASWIAGLILIPASYINDVNTSWAASTVELPKYLSFLSFLAVLWDGLPLKVYFLFLYEACGVLLLVVLRR